jgi:hypothetical protein
VNTAKNNLYLTCTKCGQTKEATTCFCKDSSRLRFGGYSSQCKDCRKEYYKRPEVVRREKEYVKKYLSTSEHKERARKTVLEWQKKPENKERIKCSRRRFDQKPEVKAKRKEYNKEYFHKPENKEWKKVYDKIYVHRPEVKKRKKADPLFKLALVLRGRIYAAIKNRRGTKAYKSMELLGCTPEVARTHIEKQFKEGMSWENHGINGWHIDHIIPLASFNLLDPEQQKKAFHYTNLQPLWAKENIAKSDHIPDGSNYFNSKK